MKTGNIATKKTRKIVDDQKYSEELFAAIVKKEFKLAEILVDGGINVNTKLLSGVTPLMTVSDCVVKEELRRRKKKLMIHLITKGAHINAIDNLGRTPLHYACICGDFDIINLLLRAGADCCSRDVNGQIPEFYLQNARPSSGRTRNYSILKRPSATFRQDSIASMLKTPLVYYSWHSEDFLDYILE